MGDKEVSISVGGIVSVGIFVAVLVAWVLYGWYRVDILEDRLEACEIRSEIHAGIIAI